MAEIIRMPRLSDTMEEGVIIAWHKKVGDKVSPGDVLAEVETDKATMDLESFHEGYLLHIGVAEGPVPVDGILAVIGAKDEDYKSVLKDAEQSENGKPAEAGEKDSREKDSGDKDSGDKDSGEKAEASAKSKDKVKEEPAADEAAKSKDEAKEEPAADDTAKSKDDDDRVKASPLARSLAKEAGVDLHGIKGSGDQGRIVKRDIEAAMAQPAAASHIARTPGKSQDIPHSQMRKTIARRLSESKYTAPHFYMTIEIDMSQAMQDRKQINDVLDDDQKISFNDMIVKACAVALTRHPAVNASWSDDAIRRHGDVHIGVAVAVDEGLLVPVIRDANLKPLTAIHEEIVEMAGRARKKRLQPEEMQGNTFTVSNLGMFGIDEFTAIINPPDACILAVGAIVDKPVVRDGEITIASMMKVTLSCDHRVVDGATGAQFLGTVRALLESPVRMLA